MSDGMVPVVGQALPAFSLAGTDGTTHTVADLSGPTGLVLYFFPKADTGG